MVLEFAVSTKRGKIWILLSFAIIMGEGRFSDGGKVPEGRFNVGGLKEGELNSI